MCNGKKGDWILNSLMIEGCEVPFKYKRTRKYKNLQGQRVNLTYYARYRNGGGNGHLRS